MKKQFLDCWDDLHQQGKEPVRRRKKFYKKSSFNKQRGDKYKRKQYYKPSPKKNHQKSRMLSCSKKKNYKCQACEEEGHYANEYKNRKNNKFIETLLSLDYFEISEEETLDLALKNNK